MRPQFPRPYKPFDRKPISRIYVENINNTSTINNFFSLINEGNETKMKDFIYLNPNIINSIDEETGDGVIHALIKNSIMTESEKYTLIKYFLIRGVPVTLFNKRKLTPLHLASQMQYESIVELLIKYKADINATDANHMNSLHMAVIGTSQSCPDENNNEVETKVIIPKTQLKTDELQKMIKTLSENMEPLKTINQDTIEHISKNIVLIPKVHQIFTKEKSQMNESIDKIMLNLNLTNDEKQMKISEIRNETMNRCNNAIINEYSVGGLFGEFETDIDVSGNCKLSKTIDEYVGEALDRIKTSITGIFDLIRDRFVNIKTMKDESFTGSRHVLQQILIVRYIDAFRSIEILQKQILATPPQNSYNKLYDNKSSLVNIKNDLNRLIAAETTAAGNNSMNSTSFNTQLTTANATDTIALNFLKKHFAITSNIIPIVDNVLFVYSDEIGKLFKHVDGAQITNNIDVLSKTSIMINIPDVNDLSDSLYRTYDSTTSIILPSGNPSIDNIDPNIKSPLSFAPDKFDEFVHGASKVSINLTSVLKPHNTILTLYGFLEKSIRNIAQMLSNMINARSFDLYTDAMLYIPLILSGCMNILLLEKKLSTVSVGIKKNIDIIINRFNEIKKIGDSGALNLILRKFEYCANVLKTNEINSMNTHLIIRDILDHVTEIHIRLNEYNSFYYTTQFSMTDKDFIVKNIFNSPLKNTIVNSTVVSDIDINKYIAMLQTYFGENKTIKYLSDTASTINTNIPDLTYHSFHNVNMININLYNNIHNIYIAMPYTDYNNTFVDIKDIYNGTTAQFNYKTDLMNVDILENVFGNYLLFQKYAMMYRVLNHPKNYNDEVKMMVDIFKITDDEARKIICKIHSQILSNTINGFFKTYILNVSQNFMLETPLSQIEIQNVFNVGNYKVSTFEIEEITDKLYRDFTGGKIITPKKIENIYRNTIGSCFKINTDLIKLLIKNNINLVQKDINNKIPIHYALEFKDLGIVKILTKDTDNFYSKYPEIKKFFSKLFDDTVSEITDDKISFKYLIKRLNERMTKQLESRTEINTNFLSTTDLIVPMFITLINAQIAKMIFTNRHGYNGRDVWTIRDSNNMFKENVPNYLDPIIQYKLSNKNDIPDVVDMSYSENVRKLKESYESTQYKHTTAIHHLKKINKILDQIQDQTDESHKLIKNINSESISDHIDEKKIDDTKREKIMDLPGVVGLIDLSESMISMKKYSITDIHRSIVESGPDGTKISDYQSMWKYYIDSDKNKYISNIYVEGISRLTDDNSGLSKPTKKLFKFMATISKNYFELPKEYNETTNYFMHEVIDIITHIVKYTVLSSLYKSIVKLFIKELSTRHPKKGTLEIKQMIVTNLDKKLENYIINDCGLQIVKQTLNIYDDNDKDRAMTIEMVFKNILERAKLTNNTAPITSNLETYIIPYYQAYLDVVIKELFDIINKYMHHLQGIHQMIKIKEKLY